MISVGTRLKNKDFGDMATVIYVDGKDITILVDGYAASNSYDLDELVREWETMPAKV